MEIIHIHSCLLHAAGGDEVELTTERVRPALVGSCSGDISDSDQND